MGSLLPKIPFFGGKKEEPQQDDVATSRPLTVTFSRGQAVPVRRKSMAYALTPFGRQKLRQLDESDPEFIVLAIVEENGPSTPSLIAERAHISPTKVDYIINRRGGLASSEPPSLRPASAGGE